MQLRAAQKADIEAMGDLLLEHGPNTWNYLPEAEVRVDLAAIATDQTRAWLAEEGGEL
ncbi:GNAT family N-acetyltransferase (fragment) [Pseudomonas sp. 8Z]